MNENLSDTQPIAKRKKQPTQPKTQPPAPPSTPKTNKKVQLSPFVFVLILILLALLAILAFIPHDTIRSFVVGTPTPAPTSLALTPTPNSQAPTPDENNVIVVTATVAPQDGDTIQGLFIYTKEEQANTHLYAYQPETLTETKITNGNWEDIHPALSPDGQKVAFASNRSGFWDIYVLDLLRNRTIQLTHDNFYDGAPSWSPDGQWIVYEHAMNNGTIELFLKPIDLSINPIQLTINDSLDVNPTWHPDPGKRQVAFISNQSGKQDVWLLDINLSGDDRFQNLTADREGSFNYVQWSPDGTQMSWCREYYGQTVEIVDLTTQIITPIGTGCAHQWSQDGTQIARISNNGNQYRLHIDQLEGTATPVFSTLIGKTFTGFTWGPNRYSPSVVSYPEAQKASWELSMLQDQFEREKSHELVTLSDLRAPNNEFSEVIIPSFNALRAEVIKRTGWDALSMLGQDFIFLNVPYDRNEQTSWYYTGRAYGLNQAYYDSNYVVIAKEELHGEVYWRVYLKVADENGSLGMPLRSNTFDVMARYEGNPRTYEAGGANPLPGIPGYWVDLTSLAARFGFERVPAGPEWQQYFPALNYEEFVYVNGYSWQQAILQLYSPEIMTLLQEK
jgi:TolB protein